MYASRSNVKKYKMYAIVEIAGQQFKVEEGKKIFVHRLEVEEGNQIDFDKVLLIEDDGAITIGEPTIKDAVVEGKILDHVRGDKVIVFKKKRKKGYRVKNGHRQNFTQVEIVSINGKGQKKKSKKAETEAAAVETVDNEAEKEKKPRKAAAHKETAENSIEPTGKTAKKHPKSKE
jgi:large subunit ribosomal protein L21